MLLAKVLPGVACEGVAWCCLRRCCYVLLAKVLLGVAGCCLRRHCWMLFAKVLLGVACEVLLGVACEGVAR